MIDPDTLAGIAEDALTRARAAGADAADVLVIAHTHLAASQRLGKPERSERAESFDLGLRVFDGKRMAMVASSDHAPDALNELAARAVAMARVVPEDPFCGLADPDQLATEFADLGHGAFTYTLLEALNGQADTGDQRVTVNELKAFLETELPAVSKRYKGSPQYPSSYGYGQDFPIALLP